MNANLLGLLIFLTSCSVLFSGCINPKSPIRFNDPNRVKVDIKEQISGKNIAPFFINDTTIVLGATAPKAFSVHTGKKLYSFNFESLNYDSVVSLINKSYRKDPSRRFKPLPSSSRYQKFYITNGYFDEESENIYFLLYVTLLMDEPTSSGFEFGWISLLAKTDVEFVIKELIPCRIFLDKNYHNLSLTGGAFHIEEGYLFSQYIRPKESEPIGKGIVARTPLNANVFANVDFFPVPYTGGFRDGPSRYADSFLWYDKKGNNLYTTNNKNIFNVYTGASFFEEDLEDSIFLNYFFFDDQNEDILYFINSNGYPRQDSIWYKLIVMDANTQKVISEKSIGKYWYLDLANNYIPWVAYRKDMFVIVRLVKGQLYFDIFNRETKKLV